MKLAPLVFVTAVFAPSVATAQIPFRCGPDCSTPGRYVLCNDNFDVTSATPGAIRLSGWLDAACTVFPAPADTYDVVGFAGFFGNGEMFVSLIEIFADTGMATPMPPADYDYGAAIPFSGTPGFSGLIFASSAMTGPFRLCIRQQIDDPPQTQNIRALAWDDNGEQNTNYVFRTTMGGWQAASAQGVTGDFILRAIVTTDDLTPWDPGGECNMPTADGGVPMPQDGGPAPGDAGNQPPVDGGPTVDAGANLDAGPSGGAPTITAISPKEGNNAAAVDVIVTGTNFVAGLKLNIGTIPGSDVVVAGSTTINASVPANIAVGVYDVIVTNPDGQSAILADGYTVTDSTGGAPVAEGCGCATNNPRANTSGAGWLLVILLLVRRRRS